MEFEWDPGKRAANILKHGLYFEDAAFVFEGVCFTEEDSRYNYGEARFRSTGTLGGRVVIVIHTRRNNRARIISMRKANEREKKKYQNRFETLRRHDR